MTSHNVSYVVLGFFFLGFCLFLLFGVQSYGLLALTGSATLSGFSIDLPESLPSHEVDEVVSRNFSVTFGPNTQLPGDWRFVLQWEDLSREKTVEEFVTAVGVDHFTESEGEYSGQGTYTLDLSFFGLTLNKTTTEELILSLKDTKGKTQGSKDGVPLKIIAAQNPILKVRWLQNKGFVEDVEEVTLGDSVLCDLTYTGKGDVKGFLYAPGSPIDSPTYSITLPQQGKEDAVTQTVCALDATSKEYYCDFTYTFSEKHKKDLGQWACSYVVTYKGKSYTQYAESTILFVAPPEQVSQKNETQDNTTSTPPVSCVPQWQCASWGVCDAGVQFRDCVAINNCSSLQGQPPSVQSCSTEPVVVTTPTEPQPPSYTEAQEVETGASSTSLWLLSGLLALLAAGGIGLVWYIKKSSSPLTSTPVQPQVVQQSPVQKPLPQTFPQQRPQSSPSQRLLPLHTYVSTMLKKGFSEEKVTSAVIKAGWKDTDIKHVFDVLTLQQFVSQNVAKGMAHDVLRQQLTLKGWKQDILDEVFS